MKDRLISDKEAGEILALAYDLDWEFDNFTDDGKERITFTIHGELLSDVLGPMAIKLDQLRQKLLAVEAIKPIPE